MKYTPEPWNVSKHATPDYAPQYGIYANNREYDHVIVKGENAEMDARLIAATPEMYTLLVWLHDYLDHNGEGFCASEIKSLLSKLEGDI
jgi:hypothetical protein